MSFASAAATMAAVDRAAAELRRGSFVVIKGRDEAALTQAAEAVTAESLARLGRLGNGKTCLALTSRRAQALRLQAVHARVVTLPLGAGMDVETVRWLADPGWSKAGDVPPRGVLAGAAEGSCPSAAVTLSKLAHLLPAAICAPLPHEHLQRLDAFAADQDLLCVRASAIADYAKLAADTLRPVSEARVPLEAADNARMIGFRPADGGTEQFAILIGDPARHQPALCRLHSECFTGDLLGSLRCDCGPQLKNALQLMGLVGHGVLLYLAHEGRGIGLINKLRAYNLQDSGLDTLDANQHLGFEPDERSYRAAAIMLRHLGISSVRLLTNNPGKVEALAAEGIEVAERVPLAVPANRHNRAYLATKARRAGHWLEDER